MNARWLGKKGMLHCKEFEEVLHSKPKDNSFKKCCQTLYRSFQSSDWKKFSL